MFRDALLESANSRRQRNRWPMLMAFTAEIVAGFLLVMLPLLSTGVISVAAHAPALVSMGPSDRLRPAIRRSSSGTFNAVRTVVVPIATTCAHGCLADSRLGQTSDTVWSDTFPPFPGPSGLPDLRFGGSGEIPRLAPPKAKTPIVISHLSEAQLVNRVDPVYPRIAIITGAQGEVRLHAVIAKDGSIQSLTVASGAPVLASAALEAVRQWRYKPYVLNGEAVEVETFITVNFKRTNN